MKGLKILKVLQPVPIEHLALSFLPHFGPVRVKRIVQQLGSPEAVFKEKLSHIRKISGLTNLAKEKWRPEEALKRAEQEIPFIEKNKIQVHSFWEDKTYPIRLKHCLDGPVITYSMGDMDLNKSSVLSVVGTRKASEYGYAFIDRLVKALAGLDVIVISGLAYGIDIATHKACVKHQIMTTAVLAHGLDRIYPSTHKDTVKRMLSCGGILTEFPSGTHPDRENFPKRNRIVAGMSDATLVIESDVKGGSMITADIANSYNRDVFALPGDVSRTYSKGCNYLIKNNKASLIDCPEDLIIAMGWDQKPKSKAPSVIQTSFFPDLNDEEALLVDAMKKKKSMSMDVIALKSQFPVSKVAALLLGLEFKGIVRSLPGKVYQLISN